MQPLLIGQLVSGAYYQIAASDQNRQVEEQPLSLGCRGSEFSSRERQIFTLFRLIVVIVAGVRVF